MNSKENKASRQKGNIRKMFGHRFVAGSWSAFASVIVIVIAVVANMIVSSLPSTATQIDMTSNSIYSLSDQTRRITASLDKDVTLYLLANRPEKKEVLLLYQRYRAPQPTTAVSTLMMGFFASNCRITANTTTRIISAIREADGSVEI